MKKLDDLFFEAGVVVLEAGRASVTLLQRQLAIGYGRASRIVGSLELCKVVGPWDGLSTPREILMSLEEFKTKFGPATTPAKPKPPKKTKPKKQLPATVNRLDEQMELFKTIPARYDALKAVRDFRMNWIELGRRLTDIAWGGDYKEWGYDEFEVYCARELGLKTPTVKKLMVSYNYMKSYEPKRLADIENGTPRAIPDYQTVEVLHKARESENVDDETVQQVHTMAFSGEEDEGFLRKEIRDKMRTMSDDEMRDAVYERRKELNDILRTARTLRRKLVHSKTVPGGLKERVEQYLVELEGLD